RCSAAAAPCRRSPPPALPSPCCGRRRRRPDRLQPAPPSTPARGHTPRRTSRLPLSPPHAPEPRLPCHRCACWFPIGATTWRLGTRGRRRVQPRSYTRLDQARLELALVGDPAARRACRHEGTHITEELTTRVTASPRGVGVA